MVEWSGEDGTSGLAAYDVQVCVDGGVWQDWRVGVTETSGVYVGTLGHTYAFRSRGHDRAGNVEAWPAVPDAETRVVARVRKTYIFGGMPVAVRLLAEGETAGLVVYLHLDHLGSPVVATDGGGDVVAEVRYYPYGGMRYQMGEMPTTLNFTGQRLDAGVGLLYYRARYYDPGLGRFIQPDTVVPEPGDPQSLNRFAYVRNNPLRFTDPTGSWEQESEDYVDPDNETLENTATTARKYTAKRNYETTKAYAYRFYCANFSFPFKGSPPITDPFGSSRSYGSHKGVDFGGSFTVLAPYEGTVVYAGSSGEAGMWKIRNKETGEVKEWSVWNGNPPTSSDKDTLDLINGYLESGDWEDIEPGWSHTEGTVVRIRHNIGSWSLETRLEHVGDLQVAQGQFVTRGQRIGSTENNGWSSGTHLHYGILFTFMGQSSWLNPICPSP